MIIGPVLHVFVTVIQHYLVLFGANANHWKVINRNFYVKDQKLLSSCYDLEICTKLAWFNF